MVIEACCLVFEWFVHLFKPYLYYEHLKSHGKTKTLSNFHIAEAFEGMTLFNFA